MTEHVHEWRIDWFTNRIFCPYKKCQKELTNKEIMRRLNAVERSPWLLHFWEKVNIDALDGCWEWTGSTRAGGYGELQVGPNRAAAHRISWNLRYGPIKDGMWVLHKCDNPPCVNPDHLFLGDHTDNMRDMSQKGRVQRNPPTGEEHPNAKLTMGEVIAIRESYAAGGRTYQGLSDEYGVAPSTIGEIIRGEKWKYPSALEKD